MGPYLHDATVDRSVTYLCDGCTKPQTLRIHRKHAAFEIHDVGEAKAGELLCGGRTAPAAATQQNNSFAWVQFTGAVLELAQRNVRCPWKGTSCYFVGFAYVDELRVLVDNRSVVIYRMIGVQFSGSTEAHEGLLL